MHIEGPTQRPSGVAPPPYDIYYQRHLQDALNQRLIPGVNLFNNRNNNGAQIMSASMSCTSDTRSNSGLYQRQRMPSTSSAYSANAIRLNNTNSVKQQYPSRERPHSVVSGTIIIL